MAEIAVAFLIHKLKSFDSFVQGKARLLQGVQGEFEDVRRELEHMQAFLRVADSTGETHSLGPQLKVWVEQVREVAYVTEDVIDEFVLRLAHHHGRGFYASLNKNFCFVKNLRARYRIASAIQEIKIRVKSIYEQYERYSKEMRVEPGSSSSRANSMRLDSQGVALLLEEEDLVGIDKPKEELISFLVKGSYTREVIPVSGMAGLGKTTLARQVYRDAQVKKHFKMYAWVSVTRYFEKEELLSDTVQQIYAVIRQSVPEDVKNMKTDELRLRIKDLLQKSRYLIVLDDVWETRDWDFIKLALPNNNLGSRIIITTRNAAVASSSINDPQGTVYNMKPLLEKDYWSLFCHKTFQGNSCPKELKSICGSILRRCGGLPLAIVAISGVLAAKDVGLIDEWINISENIGSEIEENSNLEDMTKVLSFSFNDLPYHLKSCFLYLSIFPEDHLIERMRLIRLWIAQGFVIVREGNGKTPEEVAEEYLKELLSRSLVQVADTSSDGRVITCRIHDLVREIIILKAREQNFAAVAKETDVRWPEKVRHLSVINNLQDTQQKRAFPKLRSFLAFYMENPITEFSSYGFRFLNALDLQGAPLEVFPDEIVKLFHLKYLSLKDTKIKEIPRSIQKLQNLETLDLKHTFVTELPVEIQRLKKLCHLLVYRYETRAYGRFNYKFGFKALTEIGCLRSLQKLSFIEANQGSNNILKELGKLTQLRRLGIVKVRRENGEALCFSLEKLSKLRALSITSDENEEIIDLNHLSSPPPLLRRLYLGGRMEELPRWISSLQNLAKLFLKRSQLKENPLESIQHLPNLIHLELQQVYHGERLCFKTGGFIKLKVLGLGELEKLKSMEVEDGAMPHLEKLILQRCRLLEKVPLGIEHLSKLKVLDLFDMSVEFIMNLYPGEGEDHQRIKHITEVYSSYLRNNGAWEGYTLESFKDIEISPQLRTSTIVRAPMQKV